MKNAKGSLISNEEKIAIVAVFSLLIIALIYLASTAGLY